MAFKVLDQLSRPSPTVQLEDNCLVNANELGDIYIHPLIYYSRVPNPYQQLCSSITSRWRTNNAGSYLIALATQMCTKHKVKRARGEKLFQMFRTSKRKNSHLLMLLITFCVGYTIVRATRKKSLTSCLASMSIVSYLGFPLLFAERRNGALVYSMLFQGSAITSKCVNEYKALEIPTSICLPVCFSFCTFKFSPSVTSLHA